MRNVAKVATTIASGAVLGGSLAFTTGLGLAGAQPDTAQDGLVNVAIGEIGVLEDVNVAAAAQIAASVCGVEVGPINALAETADVEGAEQAVCTNNLGAVLIEQNDPGQSDDAPGQQAEETTTTESPTEETPTEETTTEEGS